MLKKKENKLILKKIRRTKKIKNFIFLKNQLKKKNQIIKNIKNQLLFIEKQNKNYLLRNFFFEDYFIQKDKPEIGSSNLFKIKIHSMLKKKHLTKKIKNMSLGPLRVKLIQKEQEIKRVKNKLINLKKHQAYKLLILNTCLSFGVISLIYFNFYKLAIIGFGYLLIKNNLILKKKKKEYLFQKARFNKSHKKLFPILYYVVPIIGVSSGLGMFYTGYLLNGIYHEIFLERIHYLSYKPELDFLLWEYYVFSIICFSCIFIDFVISLYVIQKTE